MIVDKRDSFKKSGMSPVQSIARASQILNCLANDINSIQEIAKQCGLSLGTVHRILKALKAVNLVFQDPLEHKYYLGLFATQLSLNYANAHKWLIAQCIDELNSISQTFNETTILAIEVGLQQINLITIESKMNHHVSRSPHFFIGSESISFLAQHKDVELDLILTSIGSRSVHGVHFNRTEIKKQVDATRRQGYCVATDHTDGVSSISVPIAVYLCPVVISVVGPEIRLKSIVPNIIAEMTRMSSLISNNISQNLQ